jgi:hypothetical protein
MGDITDDEFRDIERDLLARIREIKERREGGSGPLEFGAGTPLETDEDSRFQIEASVSGDFHEPARAPHTTIIEAPESHPGFVGTAHGQTEQVIDIEPTGAETLEDTSLPLPGATRRRRATATKNIRAIRTKRPNPRSRTSRTAPTASRKTSKIR